MYWHRFFSLFPRSRKFGFDRGTPIDRYYIESFLRENSSDVQGHVLEIGDANYTRKFGGEKVSRSTVLHITNSNNENTIVGDLATGEGILINTFDCVILTQTIQFIYNIKNAILNTYKALRPGGVVLATASGISQISRYDMDLWGEYWRLTDLSANRLFEEVFPSENIQVKTLGNVKASAAFLYGYAVEDMKKRDLDYSDSDYQMLIAIRAVKPNNR